MTLSKREEVILGKVNRCGGWPTAPHTAVRGECWTFDSWHNSAGYPYISVGGRDQPAHRIVFALLTGRPVEGLDLDHLCRNVACVNPSHHEAVSHAENQRRIAKATTRCRKAGHDWADPRNVATRPNGRRYCRECERIRSRNKRIATKHLRGTSNRDKTHCKNGHPLAGENVALIAYRGRTHRRCRACQAIRNAKRGH